MLLTGLTCVLKSPTTEKESFEHFLWAFIVYYIKLRDFNFFFRQTDYTFISEISLS